MSLKILNKGLGKRYRKVFGFRDYQIEYNSLRQCLVPQKEAERQKFELGVEHIVYEQAQIDKTSGKHLCKNDHLTICSKHRVILFSLWNHRMFVRRTEPFATFSPTIP